MLKLRAQACREVRLSVSGKRTMTDLAALLRGRFIGLGLGALRVLLASRLRLGLIFGVFIHGMFGLPPRARSHWISSLFR